MSWRAGSGPPVMHHPLESYVVEVGAIAVLGGDAAQQNALNGASVEVCEGLGGPC